VREESQGCAGGVTGSTVVARMRTDRGTIERVERILGEQGDIAVVSSIEADGSWTMELHFAHAPDEERTRGLVAAVAGRDAAERMRFEPLAPTDWVRKSLAGLRPVLAGRFIVHGSHDRTGIPGNRIAIEIEASLAFGTGHHASTQGCLLAIDLLSKRLRGGRTLDVGTGSGVLAIAAAKALRCRALANDIDARSVAIARENARLNGVARLVTVMHAADVSARPFRAGAPYQLIVANILLQPLRDMATALAQLAAPNAHIVLSGLLATQAAAALASYRARGLVLLRRITLGGWATLVLQRKRAARSFAGQVTRP
jgi:ribosomal protein L11 methyltransferase